MLEYLHRRQRTYTWDDGAPDTDEGLIKPDPLPTEDIPAELPGISLKSDSVVIVEPATPPDWAVTAQVLTNANIVQHMDTDKMTEIGRAHV